MRIVFFGDGTISIPSKIDTMAGQNIMQSSNEFSEPRLLREFHELPQEIVHEIFEYIPEYGHRVSVNLHERSLSAPVVSVYCDFLRYCGRKDEDNITICVDIIESNDLHKIAADDIVECAIRYLKKNLRLVICIYLERSLSMSVDIFGRLGIARAANFSEVHDTDCHDTIIYSQPDYCTKIIELYSLMILRDNELLTKKEFDAEINKIIKVTETIDLTIVLELILAQWSYNEHIYRLVVRYFGHTDIMNAVIERLKNESAIAEGIIVAEMYYYGHEQLTRQLSYQRLSTDIEHNKLASIRNQLLDIVPVAAYYDLMGRTADSFRKLLFVIESMADEN